ncbi:MAG: hypothetical protein ACTHLE_24480 [Agriterribacter sp.]
MKKHLIAIAFPLILIVSGCKKNEEKSILIDNHDFKTQNHNIHYAVSLNEDSVIKLNFIINNKENSKVFEETLEVDYKRSSFETNIASALKNNTQNRALNMGDLKNIIASMKEFTVQQNFSTHSLESDAAYISISFFRQLLKDEVINSPNISDRTKQVFKRSTSIIAPHAISKKAAGFDPQPQKQVVSAFAKPVYEGYASRLSEFALNEDIIVDVNSFKQQIDADLTNMSVDDKGLYVFQNVLNRISDDQISLLELLAEMDDYVQNDPSAGFSFGWPRGSDHGCCGNYQGPCWYWHPVCYIHDKMCKNCTPKWFCFSGCVPDKDIQLAPIPSKPIFTFIEDLTLSEGLIPLGG